MAFVLKPISGGNPINLVGIRTRIGSTQELCDAHIDDSQILPLHCQVFHQDDGFVLQNISKGLVLVNGNPETQARLNPGDRIQIGKVIYEFADDAIPFPQPSLDELPVSGNALAAITQAKEAEALSPNQTAVSLFNFTLISSGKRFRVSLTNEKNEVLIGRDPDKGSELIFNDRQVSGLHCKIYSEDGMLKIADLNSSNGTRVNEVKISQPTQLNDKDQIKIGSSLIKLIFAGNQLTNADSLIENGITINSEGLIEGQPGLKFTLLDKDSTEGLATFSIPLTKQIILGREPGCTVRWDLLTITKKHCSIELVKGKVILKDLNSRNGTYINDGDVKVQEIAINNEDEIRLGIDNLKLFITFINILPVSASRSIMDSDSSVSSDSSLYRTIPEPLPPSPPKHQLIEQIQPHSTGKPPALPPKLPPPLPKKPWWKFW